MISSSFLVRVLGVSVLLLLGVLPGLTDGARDPQLKIEDFKGKNVIVLIIDQMRQIQDFPPGWSEANLPGLTRLQQNGLTFTQATCNAAMCSPSRATLLTGRFPAQHGARWTLEEDMPGTIYPQRSMPLPDQLNNMATMAIEAGIEDRVLASCPSPSPLAFPSLILSTGDISHPYPLVPPIPPPLPSQLCTKGNFIVSNRAPAVMDHKLALIWRNTALGAGISRTRGGIKTCPSARTAMRRLAIMTDDSW